MNTQCTAALLEFHLASDTVRWWTNSTAASLVSNSSRLLLSEVDKRTQIRKRLGKCFVDHRNVTQMGAALLERLI